MSPENIASGLRNMVDDIENFGAAPLTVDTALLRQAIAALTLADKFEAQVRAALEAAEIAQRRADRSTLTPPEGHVVVTRNEAGQAVAVTRQDDEGRILSVIAEFEAPEGYVLVPVERGAMYVCPTCHGVGSVTQQVHDQMLAARPEVP